MEVIGIGLGLRSIGREIYRGGRYRIGLLKLVPMNLMVVMVIWILMKGFSSDDDDDDDVVVVILVMDGRGGKFSEVVKL